MACSTSRLVHASNPEPDYTLTSLHRHGLSHQEEKLRGCGRGKNMVVPQMEETAYEFFHMASSSSS
eukprot:22580-Eustigmatos_ZCMA.PRE.1